MSLDMPALCKAMDVAGPGVGIPKPSPAESEWQGREKGPYCPFFIFIYFPPNFLVSH